MPKKNPLVTALLLTALYGASSAPALAGDAVAARAKARTLCENCHGENGVALVPGTPNLSGQQQEYLKEQLRAYRSGRRQGAQMNVVAKILTDVDIENLADWYSSIKISVEMPK